MKKQISIGILALVLVAIIISVPFASAAINIEMNNVKGAFAKWIIPNNNQPGNTIVYAFLSETNNGKDGRLDIIVIHAGFTPPKIGATHTEVDFTWSMDKIVATAVNMAFPWPTPSDPTATRTHTIVITFDAAPMSQAPSSLPTGITVDGTWKISHAELTIDGNTGPHINDESPDPFAVDNAFIFKGNIAMHI